MIISSENIFSTFRDWLLNHPGLTWSQSLTDWTAGIKIFFGTLGNDCGYIPIYTNILPREKEYLADIVWRVDGPRQQIFLSIESELSGRKKDILYDFRKLLDIKSKYHLGLFRLNSDIRESLLEEMKEIIHAQELMLVNEKIFTLFIFYNRITNRIYLSIYDFAIDGSRAELIREDNFQFN